MICENCSLLIVFKRKLNNDKALLVHGNSCGNILLSRHDYVSDRIGFLIPGKVTFSSKNIIGSRCGEKNIKFIQELEKLEY